MIHPKRATYFVIAGLFALFGAALIAGAKLELAKPFWVATKDKIRPNPAVEDEKQGLSGGVLALQVALMREDYLGAAHYAKRVLEQHKVAPEMLRRMLHVFAVAGDMDAAGKAADALAVEGKTPDLLALQVQLMHHLKREEYTELLAQIQKAPTMMGVERLIFNPLKAWALAAQYRAAPPATTVAADAALKAVFAPLDALASVDALKGFMQFQRAAIYDWLGNAEQARKAYASVGQPESDKIPYRTVQIISNFYLRQGDLAAAQDMYAHYAKHYPDSALQLPALPKTAEEAKALSPVIASPADGLAEVYFTIASLLMGEDPSMRPAIYLQLALSLRPDFAPAQMLLAGLYEQQNQHASAIAVYESLSQSSVFYEQSRIRVALNLHANEQKPEAIAKLQSLLEATPDHEEALLLLTDIYRHDKAFAQSASVFREAFRQSPNKAWGWEVYFKYGISLERIKRWDQAEAMLFKALEGKPEDPDILNYLGYSWLEQGKRLQEAKDYIERAYVQEPSQPHIIDSMGWAHYMLGDFDKALLLLEQAIDLAPQDPTLNEHLGDVYWRVGRTQEARFLWQRALTFESEQAEAIQRKLSDGLPPLPAAAAAEHAAPNGS